MLRLVKDANGVADELEGIRHELELHRARIALARSRLTRWWDEGAGRRARLNRQLNRLDQLLTVTVT